MNHATLLRSVPRKSAQPPSNQTNGLYLTTASPSPSNVFVKHCDFTGVSTPVAVTGTSTIKTLQITDCPGYNDQNTPVASGGFTGTQYAAKVGYFGPSVVTWSNSTDAISAITLNGILYSSNFGSIYLTSLDQFSFNETPSTVTWIGK